MLMLAVANGSPADRVGKPAATATYQNACAAVAYRREHHVCQVADAIVVAHLWSRPHAFVTFIQ